MQTIRQSTPYLLVLAFLLALPVSSAHAYVGPGLGLGAIAVVLGLVGSALLAIFTIFWYPIKRFFKKFGKSSNTESDEQLKPVEEAKEVEQKSHSED